MGTNAQTINIQKIKAVSRFSKLNPSVDLHLEPLALKDELL